MKKNKVKNFFRYISVVLAVLLLGNMASSVFAAEPIELPEDNFISNGAVDTTVTVNRNAALTTPSETYYLRSMALGSYSATEQTVYDTIRDGISNMKANIAITRNGLSIERIGELFFDVQADYLEYFYCRSGYSVSYNSSTATLSPMYINRAEDESDEAYKTKMIDDVKKFDAAVNEAMLNITSDMNDLQKALVLHDYLVVSAEYINNNGEIQHTAYGILVDKQGVCQGYAYAYNLLLKKAGVNSVYVTGTANGGSHGWNKVEIDGSWYNVDVTFDDPVSGVIGKCNHKYFLISDSDIGKDHVFDERSGPKCDSTYDTNAFWLKTETQVAYLNSAWYYIDSDGNFNKYDFAAKKSEVVFKIDTIWYCSQNLYYEGNMSKIAYDKSGIYYNTDSQIYKTAGTDAGKSVYSITPSNYNIIYGIQFIDGELAYELRNAPHEDIDEIHKTGILANWSSTTGNGDINGDEAIDILDLILLYQNLGSTNSIYDIVSNGICDMDDYNTLLKLIFN